MQIVYRLCERHCSSKQYMSASCCLCLRVTKYFSHTKRLL